MILPGRVVLATANPNKVRELSDVLGRIARDCELIPRPSYVPDVVEDADTFLGNARLKAKALVEATGTPALADDSGLVVDALDGEPGVRSSRYAGEDATDAENVEKLLESLAARSVDDRAARSAHFMCVIVLITPDGEELVARGRVDGTIAVGARGDGGFGYDPVFIPDEGAGLTFAQMSAEDKNAVSHRGRALRSLVELLDG